MKLWTSILLSISIATLAAGCKENSFTATNQGTVELASESVRQKVYDSDVSRRMAIDLFKRLTGATPNLADERLLKMEELISYGNVTEAAEVATEVPSFYSFIVRDFAVKMSNVDQSVNPPLNDLAATVIGVTRDGVNASLLLTGNFTYRANTSAEVPSALNADIISSNNHYAALEQKGVDFAKYLEKIDKQEVIDQQGQVVNLEDTAGVLTSRAFMAAHGVAGTNRRIIEYGFKVFLCAPIESWASAAYSDFRIGRDVSRVPTSDYQNKCQTCHAPMDAMRPATAHFDFDGSIRYKWSYTEDPDADDPVNSTVPVPAEEQLVHYKFRRGAEEFPSGHRVTDDAWISQIDASLFGFRASQSGQGMNAFGRLLATSERFPVCMARRAFKTVCRRDAEDSDQNLLESLGSRFESGGYNLKNLFIDVALQPECSGVNL